MMPKAKRTKDEQAKDLWLQGTQRLTEGRVEEAVELYEESIEAKPTAEGYTYRGWAVSSLGRIDEAIDDCKKAIRIDPEFGNPYNDIGVYLMQKGQLNDAIPWFETAKQAKRYEPRHFPYLNMGRVYVAKGEEMRALDEFVKALDLNPNDAAVLDAIRKIDYTVN
jgi:Tfp pilus assembly protein PilF